MLYTELTPQHEVSKTSYDYQAYPWVAHCSFYSYPGQRRDTEVSFGSMAAGTGAISFRNLDVMRTAIQFLIHVYKREKAKQEEEQA